MTMDTPIAITIAEKLLALALIIIGAIVTLDSTNPPPGDISQVSGIFTVLGAAILIAGILLLIAKTK
jgi:hypothetical protein